MTTAYIAGRISGLDPEEVRAKFKAKEIALRELGYAVNSPMLTADWDKSWEQNMKWAISLLLMSQEIHLLEGWEESRGAKIEHDLAKELGIKIVYP